MNSYLLRRLLPFYLLAVVAEIGFTIYSIAVSPVALDLSLLTIIKTLGILLLTTTAGFLIVMLPYAFYLMFLPSRFQNSKLDKVMSVLFYTFFTVGTFSEEIISALFWTGNKLPASLVAFRHNYNFDELMNAFFSSSLVIWTAFAILAVSFVTVFYTSRFLMTEIKAPGLPKRIFQTAVYSFVCILTYLNTNATPLSVSANSYNNQIAEENTYILLKKTVDDYTDMSANNSNAGTDFEPATVDE